MSRSPCFVLVGAAWTLISVYLTSDLNFPTVDLYRPAYILAGTLLLTTCLFFVAGFTHSTILRRLAFGVHVAVPLAWALWVDLAFQTNLSFGSWGLLMVIAMVGAVLSDLGLELDMLKHETEEEQARARLPREAGPLSLPFGSLDDGTAFTFCRGREFSPPHPVTDRPGRRAALLDER